MRNSSCFFFFFFKSMIFDCDSKHRPASNFHPGSSVDKKKKCQPFLHPYLPNTQSINQNSAIGCEGGNWITTFPLWICKWVSKSGLVLLLLSWPKGTCHFGLTWTTYWLLFPALSIPSRPHDTHIGAAQYYFLWHKVNIMVLLASQVPAAVYQWQTDQILRPDSGRTTSGQTQPEGTAVPACSVCCLPA